MTDRPGVPTYYTSRDVARILGWGIDLVRDHIKAGTLIAHRHSGPTCDANNGSGQSYIIARESLIAFMRRKGIRLSDARLRCQPHESGLLAVSARREVRGGLRRIRAEFYPSLFALGVAVAKVPAWGVLIDTSSVGRGEAQDAAAYLAMTPDHPLLIAVAGDDDAGRSRRSAGVWDLVIPFDATARTIAATVGRLAARAGADQPKK